MSYYPPRSIDIPFKTLVLRADPDWQRAKTDEVEYQFSNGREFRANPETRGAYAAE